MTQATHTIFTVLDFGSSRSEIHLKLMQKTL